MQKKKNEDKTLYILNVFFYPEFCQCSLDKSLSLKEVQSGNEEHIARVQNYLYILVQFRGKSIWTVPVSYSYLLTF